MEKEIKDYLPFYLGCKCETPLGKLVLSSIDLHYQYPVWFRYKEDKDGKKHIPKINYELLSKHGLRGRAFHFREVKPILRPLSSMTEEEALKMCSIVSPTIFGDYRYKKWAVTKEREWDSTQKNYTVRREGDSHTFEVDCIDGDVLLWDENTYIDSPYMNFNYRFEYLKMGFDLFGLIEAGLAINSTTINSNI